VTYQTFQNGSIVDSPRGTFPLYGAIRQKYLSVGGLNGRLGVPTSGEIGLGNGVIKQEFENGYILWNGQIATAYKNYAPGAIETYIPEPVSAKGTLPRTGAVVPVFVQGIQKLIRDKFPSAKGILPGGSSSIWEQYDQFWDRIGSHYLDFIPDTDAAMPDSALQLYYQLSKDLFDSVEDVSSGYAYDDYYYNYVQDGIKLGDVYGSHTGIDFATRKMVKTVTRGLVVGYAESTGDWIAIDELDHSGKRTGRRWWYGHLSNTLDKNLIGKDLPAGTELAPATGAKNMHLHLGVVRTYSDPLEYYFNGDSARHKESLDFGSMGGKKYPGSTYSEDLEMVLEATMNPLQAYWNFIMSVNEPKNVK
jgi:hypothetical protein